MPESLPELPKTWRYATLSELLCDGRDISYGIVQPGSAVTEGVPIVRVNNIKSGRIVHDDVLHVASSIEECYARTRLRGNEVLLTLVGSLGETAVVPKEMIGWNVARAVGVIPVHPEIGSRWVELCLRSSLCQHHIRMWATTTVQATLNLRDVRRLPIPIPPDRERETIADILGSLDDKIELNRKMNETLEAIASTIFKSWFVDFDPVVAKTEGRQPEGMDAETAKLFPDSFVESEIGRIPKGWKVASVYEIADVIYGAPFSSSLFNTNMNGSPLIRIRDLPNECPSVWTPEVHPKGYMVHAGDVVVGMDGEFRAYLWGGSDAWLNQRVCVFTPKLGVSAAFVRESISRPLAEVEATETATTVIHLGKNDIDRFKVVVPDPHVIATFSRLFQPSYDLLVAKKQESRTLASIRDALLPRLLSGELAVPSSKVSG